MFNILFFPIPTQTILMPYSHTTLPYSIFLSPLKVLNSLLFFCSEIDLPLSSLNTEEEVTFYAIINNSTQHNTNNNNIYKE
jgi:hypothetical protein